MKHFSLRSERNSFSIRLVSELQIKQEPLASWDQVEVTRGCGPLQTQEEVHPFSLKVVLSGEEICTSGKQVTRLKPGSVLLIPDGAKIASEMVGNATGVTIRFPAPRAVAAIEEEARLRAGSCPDRSMVEVLQSLPIHTRMLPEGWQSMFRTIFDASPDADLQETLMKLLAGAVRLVLEAHEEMARIPAVKQSARNELFRRICLGRSAIDEAPGLHLNQLAEACCLSPFHLHRVFTAAFGITPGSYAKHRKMDISKSLLEGTKMPVKLVAYQAGFGNPSAFVRSFRSVYGVTPMNFRKASKAA